MKRRDTFLPLVLMLAILASSQSPQCFSDPVQCPLTGCARDGTPEAEANKIRKTLPDATEVNHVRRVIVQDLETLQFRTDNELRHPQGLAIHDRKPFQGATLRTDHWLLGERIMVQLYGYIVGVRTSRSDNENCNFIGSDANNYVVNIGANPRATEFESVLVVFVPSKDRKEEWTTPSKDRKEKWTAPSKDRKEKWALLENLRYAQERKWQVRVTGQLFYDSKHRVNNDPASDLPDEPRRLSLWELHPANVIEYCRQEDPSTCDPGNATHWQSLRAVIAK